MDPSRPPTATAAPRVLLVGLDVGYYSREDVIAWADDRIALEDEPAYALIELSMATGTEVRDRLVVLADPRDHAREAEVVLGFLHKQLIDRDLELGRAAATLYRLATAGLDEELREHLYYLDDAYALAARGTAGTLDEVRAEFLDFTRPYWARLWASPRP